VADRRSHTGGLALTRRSFLGAGAALLVAACGDRRVVGVPSCLVPGDPGTIPPVPDLPANPFALGVASGDPLPDGIVLWTRLAPEPTDLAAMPPVDVPVAWELARDAGFGSVVASGVVVTGPSVAHSVHVDVRGLDAATTYWYRFTVGAHASAPGRTRTAPAHGTAVERVRFAVASCQAYQSGYYVAYRGVAADDLDFVLFLGDYIYELESSNAARRHRFPPPATLDEYRVFYGLNAADPDLQAAHAAHPWIVTWDDHEVEDNYAGLDPGGIGQLTDPDARAKFPAKRAAAYQAWWEHMPVRACAPVDGSLVIYRDFAFGDLVRLAVVDDRQYRSATPRGEGAGNLPRLFGGGPQLPGAFDPNATMLGREQETWLDDVVRSARERWFVFGQQTVMAEVDRDPEDPERGFSMDAWDGYVVPRNRLLASVRDAGLRNFVSVGGDIHTSCVADLLLDYHVPGSPRVGTELVGPSVSAIELLPQGFAEATLRNPHIHLYDTQRRGYLRCDVTRDRLQADYELVASTADPDSAIATGSTWIVEDGAPGARRV
jgi:alkaline phosphatase D